jgi:uncharacterized protein YjbI with pentapeptide repeats
MFSFAKMMNADFTTWDVSNVEFFTSMFYEADMFTGAGVSQWDVSSAEEMDFMFSKTALFDADLSDWDVQDVGNMNAMFYDAMSFQALGITEWPVSSGTSMAGMICNATGINPFVTLSWAPANSDCTGNFTWGNGL